MQRSQLWSKVTILERIKRLQADNGDWGNSVLSLYSTNCHFFPCGLRTYQYALTRLANGEFSLAGVKQLLACAPDPEDTFVH
jgi:hypothetical protein